MGGIRVNCFQNPRIINFPEGFYRSSLSSPIAPGEVGFVGFELISMVNILRERYRHVVEPIDEGVGTMYALLILVNCPIRGAVGSFDEPFGRLIACAQVSSV